MTSCNQLELACVLALLCTAFVAPGIASAGPTVGEIPEGPYAYPPRKSQIMRTSEVPFRETAQTQRYGFDKPFPKIARRRFSVESFGEKADGKIDCTPAFYQALAAAKACGEPAEIVFSNRGRYLFRPRSALGSDDMAILKIRGVSNLLIRGQGHDTVLVMAAPSLGGLSFDDSNTVMVNDFAIDYDPLPFTQGRVVALDQPSGTFILRLSPGYPTPAALKDAIPGNHAGYRMSAAVTGACRWPPITPLFIIDIEQAPEGDWRLKADPAALKGYLGVGDEFIYVGRRVAQMALGASDTKGFYLRHVAVHASPTCGMGFSNADGVNIDGYADTIPAGSNRLIASDADGIFVHGARGGITVKNSYFMGQGDDCINLHCPAFTGQYVTMHSDADITLQSTVDVRAGDMLEVMDPTIGKIKGHVTVQSANRAADHQSVRCQLRSTLSALGYAASTDRLYPVTLSASNFKLVHNYFGQNRSRCLLIQARDGLIESNTMENAEGYGLCMGYGGTVWPEGVIPSRVTVRRNVFRNVTGVGLAGAIEIGDGSDFRNFRDIVIADNQFYNTRKMAVTAGGCIGLTIIGNSVTTEAGRRNTWNHPQWYPFDCSIYLKNCTGVLVDKFRLSDPNVTGAGLYIDNTCDPGTEGVALRAIAANLPAGIPVVKDTR